MLNDSALHDQLASIGIVSKYVNNIYDPTSIHEIRSFQTSHIYLIIGNTSRKCYAYLT